MTGLFYVTLTLAAVASVTRGQGMFTSQTSLLPDGTNQLNYGVAVTNVGGGEGEMEWVVAG